MEVLPLLQMTLYASQVAGCTGDFFSCFVLFSVSKHRTCLLPHIIWCWCILFCSFLRIRKAGPVCGYYGLFVLSVCSSNIFNLPYARVYVHSKGICVTPRRSSLWLLVFSLSQGVVRSRVLQHSSAGCSFCMAWGWLQQAVKHGPCAPDETLVFVPHGINVLHRLVPSQLLCPALIPAILQSSCYTAFHRMNHIRCSSMGRTSSQSHVPDFLLYNPLVM